MLKSHEKFYSVNGKRLVLVVDDEMINREILGHILKADYEVIYAENGKKALQMIRENAEILSLVLLDLLMPEMSGMELLALLKKDPELNQIPVMVMTSEKAAEVESLQMGANEFIAKPFPQPEVILARVLKTIELSEDREIIQHTERDPLTGLYNRDYFFSYAEQYDQYHKGREMDAIVVDINHFHMINERYGKDYGDKLLRAIGEKLRNAVQDNGGIVCRREADTFLVYCPHRTDYPEILNEALSGFGENQKEAKKGRIRLRMGVYSDCDRTINIERRFDRAKLAADRIRSNYTTAIAFYDKNLHEAQIYSEQLLEDFPRAIDQHEFQVFYQPKFDIRGDVPVLVSAEALVRWIHPELGFINPGVFIPLFESNGLIQQLDYYVWKEAASQIRKWKEQYGLSVSVSVNISRIDMYDPELIPKLTALVEENGLEPEELPLEITESAYTKDSEQIIETVSKLRIQGFRIEMDDFGTGYSSLNMISTLPIDILKIDMLFIRSAFDYRKDIRMLELIMDIADYISVPVIAEGVETEEQLQALKALGCEYVQGFYFSKPVPADKFNEFLEEKKKYLEEVAAKTGDLELPDPFSSDHHSRLSLRHAAEFEKIYKEKNTELFNIVQALSQEYFSIYYVDLETESFKEYRMNEDTHQLRPELEGEDFFGDTTDSVQLNVYDADRDKALHIWSKENLLKELENNNTYSTSYRIMMNGRPVYVSVRVMQMKEKGSQHIVIGISNIDAQMQREREFAQAQEMAVKDPLTGVKNKFAYTQAEERIDRSFADGTETGLALVFCDINGLKDVNDSKGHAAGDQYIKNACKRICETFKHSPVYRVGGDEFIAILTGSDYENRAELLNQMEEANAKSAGTDGLIIAVGMAEYIPEQDKYLSEVFDRADGAMYVNKKTLPKTGAC